MSIEVGSIVEGVVSGITNFGAFVNLPEGKVGLVHISEVADVYVNNVSEFLKEQDNVKVKVLSVDEKGKIALSIKRAQEKKQEEQSFEKKPFEKKNFEPRPAASKPAGGFSRSAAGPRFNNATASFEDKLSRFLKDSDERLTDLSRKTDSKRGGRGGGRRR
ncbi:S1 domain-containing RNA-binding protein [Anaerovibrio sp. RM50]|uniref:S1 domain-containing RNA-binding protein n=1 Tax=Anaerovibrio sp. RM50 TaxID=1200557 RepID=UPI000481BF0A|nr:S1 domain-containing RNA-binding protein [Anaerovibrio sp. RM50]